MTQFRGLFLTALLVGFVAGCGSGSATEPAPNPEVPSSPSGPDAQAVVTVADNSYGPGTVEVLAGSTVKWNWTGVRTHGVSFEDGVASPIQASGTFTRTFSTAGSYPYRCARHSGMVGTINVK